MPIILRICCICIAGSCSSTTTKDRFENQAGQKGHAAIDLKRLVEPVIRKNKAEAVVNRRISAKQFDHCNTIGIGILRNVWITSGFVAGLFFAAGAAFDADTSEGLLKIGDIGVGFASPAVIGLGGSHLLRLFNKTAWTISIEGDVVRMKFAGRSAFRPDRADPVPKVS